MKLAIYSDLHISTRDDSDDFKLSDEKFIDHLRSKILSGYTVVLNGDIFETWESLGWKKYVEKFKYICERRFYLTRFLFSYIGGGSIVYITGNHDAIVRTKKLIPKARKNMTFQEGDYKIYIEHGHKGDKYNSGNKSIIGKVITFIIGWLERIGWYDIDNDLGRIEKLVANPNLESYADKVHKKTGANVIVFGHTHQDSCVIPKEGYTYINTGKCCGSKNKIDEVIIEDRIITAYRIKI